MADENKPAGTALASKMIVSWLDDERVRRAINPWGKDGPPVLEQIRRDLADFADSVTEQCDGQWVVADRKTIAARLIEFAKAIDRAQLMGAKQARAAVELQHAKEALRHSRDIAADRIAEGNQLRDRLTTAERDLAAARAAYEECDSTREALHNGLKAAITEQEELRAELARTLESRRNLQVLEAERMAEHARLRAALVRATELYDEDQRELHEAAAAGMALLHHHSTHTPGCSECEAKRWRSQARAALSADAPEALGQIRALVEAAAHARKRLRELDPTGSQYMLERELDAALAPVAAWAVVGGKA